MSTVTQYNPAVVKYRKWVAFWLAIVGYAIVIASAVWCLVDPNFRTLGLITIGVVCLHLSWTLAP